MKRKTFYCISLFLPYIALLFSGALTYVAYSHGVDPFAFAAADDVFVGTAFFFTVSGVVWAPLYTWMAIAILFWGTGKSANEVRRMYLLAPVLLGCSMGIPALLVDIGSSMVLLAWGFLHAINLDFVASSFFENYPQGGLFGIPMLWAFMAAVCLVVGYAFVAIVLLIEKVMKRRNLFQDEETIVSALPLHPGQPNDLKT